MKKSDSFRNSDLPFLSLCEDGVLLKLHIQPGASKNEISGMHGSSLKIKLTSPPVGGAANESLIEFLAKTIDIKKKQIAIVHGMKSREKIVRIKGLLIDVIVDRISCP